MIDVSIVIVNWNAGKQLLGCVESIIASYREGFLLKEIIIVDNASTDHSLVPISCYGEVKIIRNKQNLGFGKACNMGAAHCTSEFVLFLNPDTLIGKSTLSESLKFFALNSGKLNFKILGVQLKDKFGVVQRSCARFLTLSIFFADVIGFSRLFPNTSLLMHDFDHCSSRCVDHVMGAFFLIEKKSFDILGGFDEDFFVYFEDLDLSYRAKVLGYNSYFWSDVYITHIGGGCSRQVKAARLFYSLDSKLIYAKKHFTKSGYLLACVLTLAIEPIARIMYSISRGYFINETLAGYGMFYKKFMRQMQIW